MQKEFLKGAVLELHQQQPDKRIALLTKAKACADCAHRVESQIAGFDECELTVWHEPVSGMAKHMTCTVERTSSREGSCGFSAIHFTPTSAARAARSARRNAQADRIAEAISQLNPDITAAVDLLHTLQQSLEGEYGSQRTVQVTEAFKEAEDALHELERTLDPEPL